MGGGWFEMEIIKQIITLLDEHSGSLTVLITAVYVLATILICRANIKAANETQRQVDEMHRQFRESNRPYITCEYILKSRQFCGIRICNHGNMVAKDLTFYICQDFLDALQSDYYDDFWKLNESQYRLVGIGQKFDFFFSDVAHKPDVLFELTVRYRNETDGFTETFSFDLSKQRPVFSIEAIEEKLLKTSKEQQKSLDEIASSLQLIAVNCSKETNDA